MDARKDRTALRLKLYELGYEPLANKNKMTLLKGWSTFEITPALIQSRECTPTMKWVARSTKLRLVALPSDWSRLW